MQAFHRKIIEQNGKFSIAIFDYQLLPDEFSQANPCWLEEKEFRIYGTLSFSKSCQPRFWSPFASFASDSHCTYYHVMKVVVDFDVDFVQKTLCRYSKQHQRLQMQ